MMWASLILWVVAPRTKIIGRKQAMRPSSSKCFGPDSVQNYMGQSDTLRASIDAMFRRKSGRKYGRSLGPWCVVSSEGVSGLIDGERGVQLNIFEERAKKCLENQV